MTRQVLTPQPVELDVLSRLLRAHATLRRALEAEVLSARRLTTNDFEALLHLSRAPEGRLRRIDLVNLLLLTPSGVTRLLEGLEEAGLVESVHCESDARVTWARLTAAGSETIECVGVTHAECLRSLFRGKLGEDEVVQLSELLGKLAGCR